MSRQLNLRTTDEFADRLERLARRLGRPMASVLEAIGTPALEAAEADAQFEAEALEAYDAYQLTGAHATKDDVASIFAAAKARARSGAARSDA